MTTPPEWHPEEHDDYDQVLGKLCAEELNTLKLCDASVAEAFMRDTRSVHRRLYEALTPADYEEYAGTYRGTEFTSLKDKKCGARYVTKSGSFMFIDPEKVHSFVENGLSSAIDNLFSFSEADNPEGYFLLSAKIFYVFGMIHPYLDGNGHVQRLMFSAAISRHKYLEILPEWTIHPRPYDIEMAVAYEKTPNALSAVTEVLSPYVKRLPVPVAKT